MDRGDFGYIGLGDSTKDLSPTDLDDRGCGDSDPNLVSYDRYDGETDIITNHDLFACVAREDQYG
jgi:hypothetical protein